MPLRVAQPHDVPAIVDLVTRAFGIYVERIGRRPRPMDDDYAARVAARQVTLAVTDDGHPAGLVVLVPETDHLYVEAIAVDPGRQGTGVGVALLDHAEQRARGLGLGELRLSTNAKMTENLTFYPRRGFTRTGQSTVHGFDRVHFAKRLA